MEGNGASGDGEPPAHKPSVDVTSKPSRRKRRVLVDAALAVGAAALITAGVLWLQETPLRRAQKFLEEGNATKALAWSEFYLYYHPKDGRGQSVKAQALVGVNRPAEAIEL